MIIRMERKSSAAILLLFLVFLMADLSWASKKEKICDKGWECKGVFCCNDTISDLFKVYNFEDLFAKRNTPVAHAVGFWDYHSFISAAALFEPIGFGTTGGKQMQMKEIAAFLGHVGSQTSCKISSSSCSCFWDLGLRVLNWLLGLFLNWIWMVHLCWKSDLWSGVPLDCLIDVPVIDFDFGSMV